MLSFNDPALFENVASNYSLHSRDNSWWINANADVNAARSELRTKLELEGGLVLGPLGFVPFSYIEMGAINSLDLFGLDELILFSFYWTNRNQYRTVVDMGANIGLHSVLLGRMGFEVTAYEPDPNHIALLERHLSLNELQHQVTVVQSAVARKSGSLQFVRVLGNTTGSHVLGAKSDPYGDLEVFEVEATSVSDAIAGKDLVKMDVEGLEADLLTALDVNHFARMDVVCEIGSPDNAARIWDHFQTDGGVNLFSQKIGWDRVTDSSQLPNSHKEGSLFLSSSAVMPWVDP